MVCVYGMIIVIPLLLIMMEFYAQLTARFAQLLVYVIFVCLDMGYLVIILLVIQWMTLLLLLLGAHKTVWNVILKETALCVGNVIH